MTVELTKQGKYKVEIEYIGNNEAHVRVSKAVKSARLRPPLAPPHEPFFGIRRSEYVVAWFSDIRVKAKKVANKIIADWEKEDHRETETYYM